MRRLRKTVPGACSLHLVNGKDNRRRFRKTLPQWLVAVRGLHKRELSPTKGHGFIHGPIQSAYSPTQRMAHTKAPPPPATWTFAAPARLQPGREQALLPAEPPRRSKGRCLRGDEYTEWLPQPNKKYMLFMWVWLTIQELGLSSCPSLVPFTKLAGTFI